MIEEIKEMQEPVVSFDLAILARDKGFNEYCMHGYVIRSKKRISLKQIDFQECEDASEETIFKELYFNNSRVVNNYSVTAPTQSLLQKWLRDVHKIHIEIQTSIVEDLIQYNWSIFKIRNLTKECIGQSNIFSDTKHFTYEKSLEIALEIAVRMI